MLCRSPLQPAMTRIALLTLILALAACGRVTIAPAQYLDATVDGTGTEDGLVALMNNTTDGDDQTYRGEDVAFLRKNFFGRDPRVAAMVADGLAADLHTYGAFMGGFARLGDGPCARAL